MKFSYEPVPSMVGGFITFQPRVPVVFTDPETQQSIAVKALVDSGAGVTVLHPRLATLLGINITTLPQQSFSSANEDAVGYSCELLVRLKDDTRNEYNISCAFLDGLRTDVVLGRDGFFDHYRVVFEQYKNQFEVTLAKRSHV